MKFYNEKNISKVVVKILPKYDHKSENLVKVNNTYFAPDQIKDI